MRRGFGRRRRGRGDERGDGRAPIDASWLERVVQAGIVPALEPFETDEIPLTVARLGRTEVDGTPTFVAVSPGSAGDALFAAVAGASMPGAEEGAQWIAVSEAPGAEAAGRRRLLGPNAPRPRLATLSPEIADGRPSTPAPFWPPQRLGDALAGEARSVFLRALAGLEGLAAKHGGGLRGVDDRVELLILGRRVATLRADGRGPSLDVGDGGRDRVELRSDSLVDALDRVEGSIRKRAADRRVRDGEEGLRGRTIPALVQAAGLRFERRWPAAGSELDALDVAGVGSDGVATVGLAREVLGLRELGLAVDATLAIAPALPHLLAEAGPPLRPGMPRLFLAGRSLPPAVRRLAGALSFDVACHEISESGDRVLLRRLDSEAPSASAAPRTAAAAPAAERTPPAASEAAPREDRAPAEARESGADGSPDGDAAPRSRRSRGRRRRGGRRPEGESRDQAAGGPSESESEAAGDEPSFDEVSFFDLDMDGDAEDSPRRRSRGRRGRGRRGRRDESGPRDESASRDDVAVSGDESPDGAEQGDAPAGDGRRGRRRGRGRSRRDGRKSESAEGAGRSRKSEVAAPAGETEDEDDDLLLLAPDAPDLEEAPELRYEDDDGEGEEAEPESESDRIRLEREKRRLARLAKGGPVRAKAEPQEPEISTLPRGRAAVLAHADRDSVASAVLLAREWRQVEGIWVYPQAELMTFFRSVTPDLRDTSPILVVGFEAHPFRDVVQAVSLYRGRLAWFDHHEWPPEDAGALAEAIGPEHLHVEPGVGSSLPSIVALTSRRSRFSDKLVDLVTGRFTAHDHQRWGRLWWWRLGQIAGEVGDQRSALEPLLGGRPSDLAKEAARASMPPLPEELAFVQERDFRLVHFAGFTLAVVEVPDGLDLHLSGRLVRERYNATVSLVRRQGGEVIVLGADDISGRRSVDVAAMVEHLALKFAWAEGLPDADHVARLRIRGQEAHPERLDEVIAEIGMGRSILEG